MVVSATMISTLRRTSSPANAANRSSLSSAYLYSIMMVLPLDVAQVPQTLAEGFKATGRAARESDGWSSRDRNPILGSLAVFCCASREQSCKEHGAQSKGNELFTHGSSDSNHIPGCLPVNFASPCLALLLACIDKLFLDHPTFPLDLG